MDYIAKSLSFRSVSRVMVDGYEWSCSAIFASKLRKADGQNYLNLMYRFDVFLEVGHVWETSGNRMKLQLARLK